METDHPVESRYFVESSQVIYKPGLHDFFVIHLWNPGQPRASQLRSRVHIPGFAG